MTDSPACAAGRMPSQIVQLPVARPGQFRLERQHSPRGGQSPRGCCLTRCPLSSGSAGPVVIDSDWAGIDSGLDGSSPRGASSRERGRPRCPLISGSVGQDQGRHRLGRQQASWCIVSRARPVETTPLVGRADRVRASREVGAQLGDFAKEAQALIVEVEHVTNPYLASRWTVPTAISRAQIHRCSILRCQVENLMSRVIAMKTNSVVRSQGEAKTSTW
jgi:hypothetical protein